MNYGLRNGAQDVHIHVHEYMALCNMALGYRMERVDKWLLLRIHIVIRQN